MLEFSTAEPGGFRELTCSLLRRIDVDYEDLADLDNVVIYPPPEDEAE